MKKILILSLALFYGCTDATDPSIKIENQKVFDSGGKLIGVLNNRNVIRYDISNGDRTHYIYVIEGKETVTLNRTIQQGKVTTSQVEVFIDENGEKWQKLKE